MSGSNIAGSIVRVNQRPNDQLTSPSAVVVGRSIVTATKGVNDHSPLLPHPCDISALKLQFEAEDRERPELFDGLHAGVNLIPVVAGDIPVSIRVPEAQVRDQVGR